MRRLEVRKGLEQPVIIKGMQARHYWMFVIILVVAILLTVFGFYAAVNESLSWPALFIQTGIAGAALLVIRQIFIKQGRIRRFHFRKQPKTLSNRDLLRHL